MQYTIRQATPADIEGIIHLCAEHAAFEQASYEAEGRAEQLSAWLFAGQPQVFCWLAVRGDELLGYVSFAQEFSTWDAALYLHLDCLYLRPHARNFGIGEQLVREVARQAQRLGCRQIQWQTPQFNENALRFYRRIGATAAPKWRLFLEKEALNRLAGPTDNTIYST